MVNSPRNMKIGDTNTPTSSPPFSHSCTSSSSPPQSLSPQVVMSPCAACKILRRRCAEKCVLAPYFPPTEPAKFTTAHRVFGASNIIKFLQELPESQRADAVTSMVYEASARVRDPVYGCAGAICQLQKQVNELQAQLAKAQETPQESQQQSVDNFISSPPHSGGYLNNMNFFEENTNLNSLWEPLWT
ncbi:LOB domain-containing protein 1 isoform X2 [Gastrolobium bilobum]|uniref:LOB domain-containing protein 1 isoform X2 n=1 Tax=Gastrolobium bilobum TaxID=150636 RepID=UPI002AB057E5|nr:LOB domain-containing protein 1 isoform X2 [Gastrolobium bilobum]